MAVPSDSEAAAADPRLPPERLIDLLAGYWRTQVVHVFARLALADHLDRGVDRAPALAEAAGASEDGLLRLLRAAERLDLVRHESDGRWQLTSLGGMLREGRLGTMREYALAIAGPAHWLGWAQLEQAVRQGGPVADSALGSDLWTYYAAHAEEGAQFSGAMGNLSQLVSLDLVHRLDLSDCRRIVDIGGAQGVLLAALLARAPQARGVLYDRAEVIAQVQRRAGGAGRHERIDCQAGDFFESVPAGGDLYLLKQILHDYGDVEVRALLARIQAAAAPGARLLVLEMPLPEPGEPSDAALVDLNMLVLLGGRERSRADYAALLAATGWCVRRIEPLRGGMSLIEALREPGAGPDQVPTSGRGSP